MASFDFNDFLNILSDKQRAAVLSCTPSPAYKRH